MLSQGSTISFHALALLAGLAPGKVMSVEELASTVGASPTYMTKLLGRLRRAGLVEAFRGRTGGYSLALPPAAVNLWQVVCALEEAGRQETDLLPLCARCPINEVCPIRASIGSAQKELQRQMERLNVGVLARALTSGGAPPFLLPDESAEAAAL